MLFGSVFCQMSWKTPLESGCREKEKLRQVLAHLIHQIRVRLQGLLLLKIFKFFQVIALKKLLPVGANSRGHSGAERAEAEDGKKVGGGVFWVFSRLQEHKGVGESGVGVMQSHVVCGEWGADSEWTGDGVFWAKTKVLEDGQVVVEIADNQRDIHKDIVVWVIITPMEEMAKILRLSKPDPNQQHATVRQHPVPPLHHSTRLTPRQ